MVRALAGVLREGDRVLVDRRRLARRHRRARRPARRRAALRLDVLHRARKEGLGPAYIAGFRRALADGAELVLEMDCDFSHDPAAVPRLIAAAEDGADLVLGSRYVAGRRDPELGRGPALRLARREPLRADHARQPAPRPDRRLQVLPRARARDDRPRRDRRRRATPSRSRRPTASSAPGFRVVEVPISFSDREHGHSKMSRAIVAEAIWKVPLLRLRALARPSVAWRRCATVTDASFEQDVLEAGTPGRRRLLGAVVRALPRGHEGARGARRRDRDGSSSSSSTSTRTPSPPRATTCSRSRR